MSGWGAHSTEHLDAGSERSQEPGGSEPVLSVWGGQGGQEVLSVQSGKLTSQTLFNIVEAQQNKKKLWCLVLYNDVQIDQ